MNKSKMTRSSSIWLGFFLLLLIAAVAVYSIILFVRFLKSLESELSAAVIGAAAIVVVGISANITERVLAKRRDIFEAHRARKVEVYGQFFSTVAVFLQKAGKENPKDAPPPDPDLVEAIQSFTRDSILWASPAVLRAYGNFKSAVRISPIEGMIVFDTFLRAMRADLGHSNKGLKQGDLIKLFLRDPAEFDAMLIKAMK